MQKSEARARKSGLPVHPLYHASVNYRTPSGRASSATHYVRAGTEVEARISAVVRTCAEYRRKVARGVDGCTCTLTAI